MMLERREADTSRGTFHGKLGWLVVLGLLAVGCAMKTAGRGDACTRTSECAPGLACVKSVCSSDLKPIANQSQVPNLMMSKAAPGEDGG